MSAIPSTPYVITLSDGRSVVIKKPKVKDFERIANFLADLLGDIRGALGGTVPANTQELMSLSIDQSALLKSIAKRITPTTEVAACMCSLTAEELADTDFDDFMIIVMEIAGYNKRFFTERIIPHLAIQQKRLAQEA